MRRASPHKHAPTGKAQLPQRGATVRLLNGAMPRSSARGASLIPGLLLAARRGARAGFREGFARGSLASAAAPAALRSR
jgi:hypothetical protein